MTSGRIRFPGNPWPAGHNLRIIEMTVRGDEEGNLRLHFNLESDEYDAEGPGAAPRADTGPWGQAAEWIKHKNMIMSSLRWDNAGFRLPSPRHSFDESKLDGMTLEADAAKSVKLDAAAESLAVGIYLLGQDLCAGHRVKLTRTALNEFDLHWTGSVALTWLGDKDFDHEFEIDATGVRLVTV